MTTATGIAFLWRNIIAGRGVRILAYHGVEIEPTSPFSVSVADFEQQIAYLTRHCEIIGFTAFRRWQRRDYGATRPLVVLTFDDGFLNNLEFAVPILEKYRAPATFFLIGAKLDAGEPGFMVANDAARLAENELFQIGSHSLNHRSIARISAAEKQREIAASKALLEVRLGRVIDFFCYPYGTFNDFDASSAAIIKQAGYALSCTSVNGVNLRGTDPFRLRRTKVEWSDDIKTFSRLIGGAMDAWFLVDYLFRFLQRPRSVAPVQADDPYFPAGSSHSAADRQNPGLKRHDEV